MELYKKYRPKTLDEVRGQPELVKSLKRMVAAGTVPQAVGLFGPTGTGKTTVGRILAEAVGCDLTLDFIEMNAADFNGVDNVRAVRESARFKSLARGKRVWLVDECALLTKQAQSALLKMLEDPPAHVHYFLATTDPAKLLRTVRGRLTPVTFRPLQRGDLKGLLSHVAKGEKCRLEDEVSDRIVGSCGGSAREALVRLEQVLALDTEEERLAVICPAELESAAIGLARVLISPRSRWVDVAKVLSELEEEDEEGLRRLVLAYSRKVLLGGKLAGRAYAVIQAFRDDWFSCGKAGLAAACYEVLGGK